MAKEPFLGVPQGTFCVETPDGVFHKDGTHSLYDHALMEPTIPGDYDLCQDVRPPNDAGKLHGE